MNKTELRITDRQYWLDRTTAKDMESDIGIIYVTNHRTAYMTVSGKTQDVLDHVAWIVQNDSCTIMYEHMLWRVYAFTSEGGKTTVKLSKSHYAGD